MSLLYLFAKTDRQRCDVQCLPVDGTGQT